MSTKKSEHLGMHSNFVFFGHFIAFISSFFMLIILLFFYWFFGVKDLAGILFLVLWISMLIGMVYLQSKIVSLKLRDGVLKVQNLFVDEVIGKNEFIGIERTFLPMFSYKMKTANMGTKYFIVFGLFKWRSVEELEVDMNQRVSEYLHI